MGVGNMPSIEKKCEQCGTIFMVAPSRAKTAKFCSNECKNNSQRTGTNVVCANCGKEFYRRQYHIDRQEKADGLNFCSNECKAEYKHNNSVEQRICEICGEPFECPKTSTQRFCSQECRYEWNKTIVGDKNPQYNHIQSCCEYCGKLYELKPSQYERSNHHFCSIKCRQDWYANIYSQTDEYKEMCRKRAVDLLNQGYNNTTNSLPQRIINSLLDELNINYINEKSFVYYAVDNYLLDFNLIIEVMGDYWHCNPIVYSKDRINDVQKGRIYKDKTKHSYIFNNYNIQILYLWEADIMKNIELCKQLIIKYINNCGKLENYHSFNYFLNNNNLFLSDEIIVPYQDYKTI